MAKKQHKRKVDFLVLSDVHLGTYGCHSKELLKYLNSIKPKMVVLNGDIIDMWQFSKRYWPKSHMQVVHKIMNWVNKGVKVYYITGNHDEMLRKFAGNKIGSLIIENKLVVELDGQKVWLFHGDVFDVTMQHSKWLAKLGSHGYDFLILLNAFCNWVSVKLGRGKISLSKNIKNSVKKAVKFINDFEKTAAEIAISKGYDYVICGHIHHPEIKKITTEQGEVTYMNSGDWIENLTALEYHNQEWTLFRYKAEDFIQDIEVEENDLATMDTNQIFTKMLDGFMETNTSSELKFKR
jgi:UDP-2,3-diacylglucosamine pyrophosphatase LpxH